MGVSTDGIICFGIKFKEGFKFPWDTSDTEGWWLDQIGYKPPHELFDINGNFIDKVHPPSQSDISNYFEQKREFLKANPLPFERVNYCSGDYPEYIIAVPGTVTKCSRGYPVELKPSFEIPEDNLKKFLEFCKRYLSIELTEVNPKWYLCSYWG